MCLGDFLNLAHRNSLKLTQIIRPITIILNGKFQENRMVGSHINYCPIFGVSRTEVAVEQESPNPATVPVYKCFSVSITYITYLSEYLSEYLQDKLQLSINLN